MSNAAFKLQGPAVKRQTVGRPESSPIVHTASKSTVIQPNEQKTDHQRLIGPHNEDYVEISGITYKALIDSGSQISSITEDLWKGHPKLRYIKLSSADVIIEGANGQKVSYLGIVPISLTVIGITYEDVPVFVVPTDSYRRHVPVLIGTNVIRASKQDNRYPEVSTSCNNFIEKTSRGIRHISILSPQLSLLSTKE